MKYMVSIVLCTAFLAACRQAKPFDPKDILTLSKQHHLLNEKEAAIAEVNIASIPTPDIRSVAGICRKISFQTAVNKLNLDRVNPDSSFSYLKFFREQLSQRSKPNPKGPVYIENTDAAKHADQQFLRILYDRQLLSPSQYAKLSDQLRQEPVVYPFVVFEWIETMP